MTDELPLALSRFEHAWKTGDRDLAREIAREFIDSSHPQLKGLLRQYSREGLVRLVDAYRAAGQDENRVIAEMWLLVEYEPQRITGHLDIHLPGVRALRGALHGSVLD